MLCIERRELRRLGLYRLPVDARAIRLLRSQGWQPGALLGSGAEGTVLDLSPNEVAKVWHGRTRTDLDALQRFGSALTAARLPFATPEILQLLEDDEILISIERKMHGQPLAERPHVAPTRVDAEAIRLLGDTLEALSRVAMAPGLDALPILPGERQFDRHHRFSAALADLVERRFHPTAELLRHEVKHVDKLVDAVVARLRALPPTPRAGLLHGDLIPANVLVQDGTVTGVLDFGFLSAPGDPHFGAAITASVFDMYGPHAQWSEDQLSRSFAERFSHDAERYVLDRAAYAVVTHAYFAAEGTDGHFAWCVRMLQRADVATAVLL